MIIEFFGVPGAGKSTLLKALLQTLKSAREVRVTSRADVVWGVMRFVFWHPLCFCVWMCLLVTNARGLFRYKLGLLLRAMALRARAQALSKQHIVLIDEGLLQRVLTIFEAPLSRMYIAFLLKMTPLSHITMVVRGGDFERFVSAPNRAMSPRVRRGQEQFERWMKVVSTNTDMVAAALPEHTTVIGWRRGGDSDLQAVRREIEQLHKVLCLSLR